MPDTWDKLVVALDLDSQEKIKEIINTLSSKVNKFKIGPVAFVRFGPQVLSWVQEKGADVFLDLKFYDIPNTMVEAAKALVDLDVWAFTVHLKAGKDNLFLLNSRVSDYSKEKKKRKPLIFGVTELTSEETSLERVLFLAKKGKEAGVDGIVSSVWEARKIKDETGLLTITPGIRKESAGDDQKRTATLWAAKEANVDYYVVGRPIVKSSNPLAAAESLMEEK